MTPTTLLNPGLFARMAARLGDVRVVHPGRANASCYMSDPLRGPDARRLVVSSWGESYTTDCLFCRDSRRRLWVNHLYGRYDPVLGRTHTNLWHCFNTECQAKPANRDALYNRLMLDTLGGLGPVAASLMAAGPATPVDPDAPLPEMALPGRTVSLADLPAGHPANLYLAGRGYQPMKLVIDWDVSYCETVDPRDPFASVAGRIIIPVTQDGRRVGWQARYAADVDFKKLGVLKYLHYFSTGRCLYGLDEVPRGDPAEPVPLFEGVTDVWRWGFGGLGRFAKGLGHWQAKLCVERLSGRTLVLVADGNDPDAPGKCVTGATNLARAGFRGKIGLSVIPYGLDPSRLERAELAAVVARGADDAVSV